MSRLRRAVSLLLMRASVITRSIAVALAYEISFPGDEPEQLELPTDQVEIGTTQVEVGLTDDGRNVHIGVQAIGGVHDGRHVVGFDVEPATANVLADSLTTAAVRAAAHDDDNLL